jgi:RNA polymerase sigma-70 factor (ECF subfamily)
VTIGDPFERVLAGAQAGDRAAVEAIYRDTAPLVIGYLRSAGAHEPEDVASDVFVSMMGSIASFHGDESRFRSWLLTIAHRRLVDDLRKRGRRPADPLPEDDAVIGTHDGESQAMARLRSRGVLDSLDQLTDDQRSALMLRILSDLPVSEIAAIMEKSETAVKALLRRGFASLERLLSQEEAGDG